MKTCERCSQEFEDFVANCPDCEIPLVDPSQIKKGPGDDAASFFMSDATAANAARELLAEAEIPFFVRAVPGTPVVQYVLAPGDLDRARETLALSGDLHASELPDHAGTAYSFKEQGATADAAEWAALPAVPREPGAAIPILAEGLRRGTPPVRASAAARLGLLGRPGLDALLVALPEFVHTHKDAAVFTIARELRERVRDVAQLASVSAIARDVAQPLEVRLLALHALGRFELPALARTVVDLIDDPAVEIREAADETLCCLTDEDLGFDPGVDSAQRKTFLTRWEAVFRGLGV